MSRIDRRRGRNFKKTAVVAPPNTSSWREPPSRPKILCLSAPDSDQTDCFSIAVLLHNRHLNGSHQRRSDRPAGAFFLPRALSESNAFFFACTHSKDMLSFPHPSSTKRPGRSAANHCKGMRAMNRNQAIAELKNFTKASNAAWRRMMSGSETDARTVRGEEGHNYLAWCAAADAECAFRTQHDLLDYPIRRRAA